jgi:hypothetical protein
MQNSIIRIALIALCGTISVWAQPRPASSKLAAAVDEFKLQTKALGLRLDSPAVTANKTSKQAALHGRFYENFRNNFLDAVPHEIVQRGGEQGLLRRNQFGFNISGPLLIPGVYNGGQKSFFSVSYEGMREKTARTSLRTIPTMLERTGDWSQVVDSAGAMLAIFDPASTSPNPNYNPAQSVSRNNLQYNRLAFAQNRIPNSLLDQKAQAALAYYPAPNTNVGPFFRNNFVAINPEVNKANGLIISADHTIHTRHKFNFKLNHSNGISGVAPFFKTIADPNSPSRDIKSRRASLEHVFTVSASRISTVRFTASTDQSAAIVDEKLGVFPEYRLGNYTPMGRAFPASRDARHTFLLEQSYSSLYKNHRLLFSNEFSKTQANSYRPRYPAGSFRFGEALTSLPGINNTGHAFASFLLGGAEFAELSQTISPTYLRASYLKSSARDEWEVRPGLTFTLRGRLNVTTPRIEKYDRQSTISFDVINPANGKPGALVAAGRNGLGRAFKPTLVRLDYSAGLAWTIKSLRATVLRIESSRSQNNPYMNTTQWGTQAFNGTPNWISSNPQLSPAITLATGFTANRTFPDLRPEAANDTNADLIDSTSALGVFQELSVSIQHEIPKWFILSVTGFHSNAHDLFIGDPAANLNAIPLSALSNRDKLNDLAFNKSLRPYPQYQRFSTNGTYPDGHFVYDNARIKIEKRSSSGLSTSFQYTFSKGLADWGTGTMQDYYNRRNEWSYFSYEGNHFMTLTYMYELPFGPNKRFLRGAGIQRFLFSGWSLSGVSNYNGGYPLVIRSQFNNTGGVVESLYVNVVPGNDGKVTNPGPSMWFNPAAFTIPEDFRPGNVARTHSTLRSPASISNDISFNKRFNIRADNTMEFSASAFNAINHANWNEPDQIIGPANAPNVNAGKIIGSSGGRVIQLGLRYNF